MGGAERAGLSKAWTGSAPPPPAEKVGRVAAHPYPHVLLPQENGTRRGVSLPHQTIHDSSGNATNLTKPSVRGSVWPLDRTGITWQPADFGANSDAKEKGMEMRKKLSPQQREELLQALQARFEQHRHRHKGWEWGEVQARLEANPDKLWSLQEMERTGGEPGVVGQDKKTGEYLFYDCSPETPKGRVSVCFDREGLESRKEHKPKTTAMDMAVAMGIELLTEEEYIALQKLGEFDTKTSSWIATPADMRKRGGALYAERRYGRIFIGHNGAQSYYAVRGFRGSLRV